MWQADKSKMTEMFSQQAEKVTFERPVEVKGEPCPELRALYMLTPWHLQQSSCCKVACDCAFLPRHMAG